MKSTTKRGHRSRIMALVAFVAVGILFAALPAYADTSQSTGHAVDVTLLNLGVTNSGTYTAANDGTTETHTGNTGASIPALPNLGQLVSAGVLVQQARAFDTGISGACAGLVGQGGTVQIGTDGTCVVSGAPSGGVSLLGGAIKADAVLEYCTADSAGNATAHAQLVNLKLADGTPIDITLPSINIPGVANLQIGPATTAGTGGHVAGTALHLDVLSLLGINTLSANIGHVSCGANAATGPISAFPTEGLPIAGGIVALVGGALFLRRRSTATKAAA